MCIRDSIIPIICKENKIDFDITNYKFLLKKFYKGGQLEKTLTEDFDTSLFEEPFIAVSYTHLVCQE